MNRITLHFKHLAAIASLAVIMFSACSEEDKPTDPGSSGNPPALTLEVDDAIEPAQEELPGFTAGATRPVAALVDGSGRQIEFVENELWISTGDDAALLAFLGRWNGSILQKMNFQDLGIAGVVTQYLVRVDASLADASSLIADLQALEPDRGGELSVSSDAALKLLAAGATEARSGFDVGINWVGLSTTFRDDEATEAPTSDLSGYDTNAFEWASHSSGSTQDIGVADAWRMLEVSGKLDNKVKIAILDGGFSNLVDIPRPFLAISNVPFFSAMDQENLSSCSGGASCPWHGTNTASSAMAIPDDGIGGAGPAGPVASPILVMTLPDFFTSIFALGEAWAAGARIANMSYSAPVPAILSWSVLPFDLATLGFRAGGMLMFASAGNSNVDVDAEDCIIFDICWEEAWHTPCENGGVICVGGLGYDSKNKAGGSNYGNEEVDIFAPYTLLVGPDPTSPGNMARQKSGTSFSSPFTAGVAALIWAADPSLSADEVESILMSTAHTSPDPKVRRYVNAKAAVQMALGDTPPLLVITSPPNGATYSAGGTSISFSADAEDNEDGTPTVTWTSSRDGVIGTGTFFARTDLSNGSHLITARASDSGGNNTEASVTITVENDPPTMEITNPANGASFFQSQAISLSGTSFDINDLGPLPNANVSWSRNGVYLGTGHSRTIPGGTLSLGSHTIRFTGTDGSASAYDEVTITVAADPVNVPPSPVITSPADGYSAYVTDYDAGAGRWYLDVVVVGNASDPEDGNLPGSSLSWKSQAPGQGIENVGTGTSRVMRLYSYESFSTPHTVTLTATDSGGNVVTYSITINVRILS